MSRVLNSAKTLVQRLDKGGCLEYGGIQFVTGASQPRFDPLAHFSIVSPTIFRDGLSQHTRVLA